MCAPDAGGVPFGLSVRLDWAGYAAPARPPWKTDRHCPRSHQSPPVRRLEWPRMRGTRVTVIASCRT